VDPRLRPVAIAAAVWNEMCAHAVDAEPEECCGLLTGDARQRYRHAHRCQNDMTALHRAEPRLHPRDGREAFHMNELDYERVLHEAETAGETVTAVYHSHVGPGAYLSELDQQFALDPAFPFPDADQIVLAVFERRVIAHGLFRRRGRGRAYSGRMLAPVLA
jgi:proteasome lid subunit RPN8/RPN11